MKNLFNVFNIHVMLVEMELLDLILIIKPKEFLFLMLEI